MQIHLNKSWQSYMEEQQSVYWKYMLYTLGITCRALYKTQSNTAAMCARMLWRLWFFVIDLWWCVQDLAPQSGIGFGTSCDLGCDRLPRHSTCSHCLRIIFFQCFETSSFKQERKRATMTAFYPVARFSFFFQLAQIRHWTRCECCNGNSWMVNHWASFCVRDWRR